MHTDPHQRYLSLIGCFEHPRSEWRRVPRAEQSGAALTVRLGMELLARIERLGWGSDVDDVAGHLLHTTLDDVRAYGVALQMLGATRMHRLLGLLVGQLRFPGEEHSIEPGVALGKAASRPGLARVWYAILGSDELEVALWRFVRERELDRGLVFEPVHRAAWQPVRYERPTPPLPVPGAPRIVLLEWQGDTAPQLIDAWLERQGGALHFNADGPMAMQRFADGQRRSSVHSWRSHLLDDQGIGVLLAGQPPPTLSVYRWVHEPGFYLASLLSCFEWVVVPLNHVGRRRLFAFICPDPHLQHDFLQFVVTSPFRPLLVGFHQDPELLGSKAQGAAFGEGDRFGEAALVAAQSDDALPLVVARFSDSTGFWWVGITQQCACLAMRRCSQYITAVYRAPTPEVFAQLWSKLGRDSNIASLAVPGHSDPERLVDQVALGGEDDVEAASREFGWAYAHLWGGGSDEHYAVFHCEDADITQQVYHHAASRLADGWWLGGRWSRATPLSAEPEHGKPQE